MFDVCARKTGFNLLGVLLLHISGLCSRDGHVAPKTRRNDIKSQWSRAAAEEMMASESHAVPLCW